MYQQTHDRVRLQQLLNQLEVEMFKSLIRHDWRFACNPPPAPRLVKPLKGTPLTAPVGPTTPLTLRVTSRLV